MKVLITGGAGFIGSHLAERLLARGDGVLVLDDLSTGSMSNIEHLVGMPGFTYRIGSALENPLGTKPKNAMRSTNASSDSRDSSSTSEKPDSP